jgi:hypothetical protein
MTAAELIEKLQALSEEEKQFEVSTEGCDCDGDCAKVEVQRLGNGMDFIYLRRAE